MRTGPDPKAARTPAEFVATMRQLRTWADLSYRQVERNATQAGDILPRATISGALARADLPREELLAAFVRACGGDAATVDTWLTARRELAISAEPTVLANAQDTPEDGATQQPPQGHENTPTATPPPPSAATPTPDAQGHENTPEDAPLRDAPSGNNGDSTPSVTSPQPLTTEPTETTAQHQPPSPPDQDTRPRYLPMTLTGAAAAAGVLLIALWPGADKPTTAQPESSPTASSVNTTPPTTPSPSAPSSTAPDQADAEKTTDTPTTRPAPKPTPSPRKTSTSPRAPPGRDRTDPPPQRLGPLPHRRP
ncbi:hypothetical protein [Streptomyces yanii]|uniref:hypothetical protein n=1 Tax=Streptomyces yanii TaxID=78510 RepID=UPI0031E5627F